MSGPAAKMGIWMIRNARQGGARDGGVENECLVGDTECSDGRRLFLHVTCSWRLSALRLRDIYMCSYRRHVGKGVIDSPHRETEMVVA